MRRIFGIALAAILLSLCACGWEEFSAATTIETTEEFASQTTEKTYTRYVYSEVPTTAPPPIVRDENAEIGFMSWFPIGMSPKDLLKALRKHGIEIDEPDQAHYEWLERSFEFQEGFTPVHDGRWYEPVGAEFLYKARNFDLYSGLAFIFHDEDNDQLSLACVRQPEYATPEGIRIGDSREKVAAVYELGTIQGYSVPYELRPAEGDEQSVYAKAPAPYDGTWLTFRFWDRDNLDILTGWSYGCEGSWESRN